MWVIMGPVRRQWIRLPYNSIGGKSLQCQFPSLRYDILSYTLKKNTRKLRSVPNAPAGGEWDRDYRSISLLSLLLGADDAATCQPDCFVTPTARTAFPTSQRSIYVPAAIPDGNTRRLLPQLARLYPYKLAIRYSQAANCGMNNTPSSSGLGEGEEGAPIRGNAVQ